MSYAIRDLSLPPDKFRIMGIREWKWVEKEVNDRFVNIPFDERGRFLFENIYPAGAGFAPPWSMDDLRRLAPADTPVFAGLGDEAWKYWWCEGNYGATLDVFEKCVEYDVQLAMVSRSFDWIYCVSHHDDVYAKGEPISTAMKQFVEDRGARL